MSLAITSSTDLKVTYIVGLSPSMTEITLDFQTMMCSMSWGCLTIGWTGVQGAVHAVVTEIQTNVALDISGQGERILDQDSGSGRGDPLAIGDLNLNDIFVVYGRGHRGSGA